MKELIIAFGLFLFIEGILYAIFPSKMKSMLKKLELVNDSQLRTGGLIFAIIGFINLVAPFFLIAYGVKSVQSNLAAILMSTTPLSSTVLGHFFTTNEKFNFIKTFGILIGFSGIVYLFSDKLLINDNNFVSALLIFFIFRLHNALNSLCKICI